MTKDYLRFIIILDERGLQWWKRWKEVSDFCEPLAWNRGACIRTTLLQMNILPEEKLCGSTKYKIFIMYIKQYISAIRTLTSKFCDQKRKDIQKMNRKLEVFQKCKAKKKDLLSKFEIIYIYSRKNVCWIKRKWKRFTGDSI